MATTEQERVYIAIDLKSFYASVECVERHLDPLTTHLVVADPHPDREDHLSGGDAGAEGLRDLRARAAF